MDVAYVRDGKKASAPVTLAELPDRDAVAAGGGETPFGLSLQTLTPRLAESMGLGAGIKGAVIVEVQDGSPADKAGLTAGDVIVEADRKPVATVEDVRAALKTKRARGHLLRVRGPNGARFVTLSSDGR